MKQLLKQFALKLAQRNQFIKSIAAYIVRNTSTEKDSYNYLKEKFIENGKNSMFDCSIREKIVSKFEKIDREVPIGYTPTDGLFLAEILLNTDTEGDIVECGCYAGGSSAKLSIVTKLLNRKIIIFDSFEGLPAVEQNYLRDKHCRRNDSWVTDWTAGRYASRLEEVQDNIKRYGELSVCSFIRGWFSETMTDDNLPQQIAFAFVDVDLANSARDCFIAIWPNISEKGIYVTHDTAYIKVLQELYNPAIWKDRFKSIPPILFGAGFGLCNNSPHIGYMVKGENLSPEYLKSLTIDK